MTKLVASMQAERICGGVLGAMGWAAALTQCYWAVENYGAQGVPPLRALINALSFFTILTNMLAATVLIASFAKPSRPLTASLMSASARTAIASYILIVGLVYALILRRLWSPVGFHFVIDAILHYMMPAGYLVYWLLFVPKGTLVYRSVWRWTLYPLVYLVYSAIRGKLYGFFAYPFLNFPEIGVTQFGLNVLALIAVFIGTGLLLVAADHFLARFGRRVSFTIVPGQ